MVVFAGYLICLVFLSMIGLVVFSMFDAFFGD